MEKKGDSVLYLQVGKFVIVLLAVSIILYSVNSKATGEGIQLQALSYDIAYAAGKIAAIDSDVTIKINIDQKLTNFENIYEFSCDKGYVELKGKNVEGEKIPADKVKFLEGERSVKCSIEGRELVIANKVIV